MQKHTSVYFIGFRFTVIWYSIMRNTSVLVLNTVFLKPLEFSELLNYPLLFITTPLITSEFMIRWSPWTALEIGWSPERPGRLSASH